MKQLSALALIFLWITASSGVTGENKPWTKSCTTWSANDVQQILSDSPWAQTQYEAPLLAFRSKEQGPQFQIIYRFLLAKPIREALFRFIELNPKSTQAEIEAARRSLDSGNGDAIVISVSYASRYPNQANSKFSKTTTSLLSNNTYLTLSSGRRLFLKEYQAPNQDGLGAKFGFPRLVDGRPFIGAGDRLVRFDSENLDIHNIQFKISDMTLDGTVEY